MKMPEIRRRAKEMGVPQMQYRKKGELIRAIQRAEGNFDCYGSAERFGCPQGECCWRSDCLSNKPLEKT
jgi:hypothetical protein